MWNTHVAWNMCRGNPSAPLCTLVTTEWKTCPLLTESLSLVDQRSVAREQSMPRIDGSQSLSVDRCWWRGGRVVDVCLHQQRGQWAPCRTGSQNPQIQSVSHKYTASTMGTTTAAARRRAVPHVFQKVNKFTQVSPALNSASYCELFRKSEADARLVSVADVAWNLWTKIAPPCLRSLQGIRLVYMITQTIQSLTVLNSRRRGTFKHSLTECTSPTLIHPRALKSHTIC